MAARKAQADGANGRIGSPTLTGTIATGRTRKQAAARGPADRNDRNVAEGVARRQAPGEWKRSCGPRTRSARDWADAGVRLTDAAQATLVESSVRWDAIRQLNASAYAIRAERKRLQDRRDAPAAVRRRATAEC